VCDDFCNALTQWQTQQGCLPTTRQGEMSDIEMLKLVVFYHFPGYNRVAGAMLRQGRLEVLLPQLRADAPDELLPQSADLRALRGPQPRLLPGLFVLLKWLCGQSERTGFYIAAGRPRQPPHPL